MRTRCTTQVCTIVRLTREVDELRKSAIAPQTVAKRDTSLGDERPGPQFWDPRPAHGEAELRRRLGLSEGARRSLEAQLLPLQRANEAMAAELRDLREGSETRA